MVYEIKFHKVPPVQVALDLQSELGAYFKFGLMKGPLSGWKYLYEIYFDTVRLLEYRYTVTGRKAKTLDHAGWITFNNLVNEVLDRYKIEALVQSSEYVIRRGHARRMSYPVRVYGKPLPRLGTNKDFIQHYRLD